MKTIPIVYIILALITCAIGLALAPAQVAEIAASTGQLSNKLKVIRKNIICNCNLNHYNRQFACKIICYARSLKKK